MNPRIEKVTPGKDYNLTLTFTNGEVGLFDMKPYLEIGIFRELKQWELFATVKPFMGTVQWIHEQDLCPDTLYEDCKIVAAELSPR